MAALATRRNKWPSRSRGVPDEIAERLRERAARNHRSLQGELMAIVSRAAAEMAEEPTLGSAGETGPGAGAGPFPSGPEVCGGAAPAAAETNDRRASIGRHHS